MKISIILFLAILFSGFISAQKYIQVIDQVFSMKAIRNGEPVNVETKNFGINLNYETGDFLAKINIEESRLYSDSEVEFRIPGGEIIEIVGTIPINEIIDNQEQTREYTFELEVKHLAANVEVIFHFNTGYISNTAKGVTIFRVNGKINLLDFGVEDLKGYEPEVELLLSFQAYMVGG
jgi:hypothetical protein